VKNLFKLKKELNLGMLMALTLVYSSSRLLATEARSAGMGISTANENTWATEGQLPYIYSNPAAIGNFGPMIYGEYGAIGGLGKGGIILQPTSALNVGIFVGHTADTAGITKIHTAFTSFAPTNLGVPSVFSLIGINAGLTNQNASLIGEYNLGKFILGAGFSYARAAKTATSKDTNTKQDITVNVSDIVLKPVIGFIFDANKLKFDGSIAYRINGVDDSNTFKDAINNIDQKETYKNNGLGDIVSDFQAIFEAGHNTLHATVGFDYLDRNSKYDFSFTSAAGTFTNEVNYFESGYKIKAGISDELKISNDVLAFAGVGFSMENITTSTPSFKSVLNSGTPTTGYMGAFQKSTDTRILVPVFLGMEASLSEKWQGRFGVKANLFDIKPAIAYTSTVVTPGATSGTSITTKAETWNDSAPRFATGITFKISNLAADWNVSVPLFTSGPFIVSGNAIPAGMATDFAVSYKFGENSGKTTIKKDDIR